MADGHQRSSVAATRCPSRAKAAGTRSGTRTDAPASVTCGRPAVATVAGVPDPVPVSRATWSSTVNTRAGANRSSTGPPATAPDKWTSARTVRV